jgi:hypothetical protein
VTRQAAQIRAGITKVVLDHRSSLPAAERERFEAAIGADAIARIEAKFNTTMIASVEHVAIVEALRAIIGGARLQQYFADAYLEGFSKIPLLRSLIEATLRTFGASPGHMAKVMPRAWSGVATETGEFTVEVDDAGQRAVLRLTKVDPALVGEGAYADTFAGTFLGFLRQCRVEGEVEITELDNERGTATFEMRWR